MGTFDDLRFRYETLTRPHGSIIADGVSIPSVFTGLLVRGEPTREPATRRWRTRRRPPHRGEVGSCDRVGAPVGPVRRRSTRRGACVSRAAQAEIDATIPAPNTAVRAGGVANARRGPLRSTSSSPCSPTTSRPRWPTARPSPSTTSARHVDRSRSVTAASTDGSCRCSPIGWRCSTSGSTTEPATGRSKRPTPPVAFTVCDFASSSTPPTRSSNAGPKLGPEESPPTLSIVRATVAGVGDIVRLIANEFRLYQHHAVRVSIR